MILSRLTGDIILPKRAINIFGVEKCLLFPHLQVWCGLTNSGELIAVKQIVLNTNDMDRAEMEYEKIQEEVELLKTLKHKNIVGYVKI